MPTTPAAAATTHSDLAHSDLAHSDLSLTRLHLMRAGYLTKAHRDDIAANVPSDIKDRFARVIGSTPTCPKPPWWASLF